MLLFGVLLLVSQFAFARRARQPSEVQNQKHLDRLKEYFNRYESNDEPVPQDYHRKTCPYYDPVRVSEWEQDSEQFTSNVLLPNVDQATIKVTISESGDRIRVKGLRDILMHQSCLPQDAKVTPDGKSEILDRTILVPADGNGAEARLEKFRGGVRLFVPLKVRCAEYEAVRVSEWILDSENQFTCNVDLPNVEDSTVESEFSDDGKTIRVTGLRKIQLGGPSCLPRDAKTTKDGKYEMLEAFVPLPRDGNAEKAQVQQGNRGVKLFVPLQNKCPPYQPVRISDWKDDAKQQLTLTIDLPGVDQSTLKTVLADDGSKIRVTGLRKIPDQARSCLPPGAKIAKDNRHEIIEAVVSVPKNGDGENAQVESLGEGVQLFVPKKMRCSEYKAIKVSDWSLDSKEQFAISIGLPGVDESEIQTKLSKDGKSIHVTGLRKIPANGLSCLPQDAKTTKDGKYEILETIVRVPKHGDVEKAEVEQIHGGVKLFVPSKTSCASYKPIQALDWELDSQNQLKLDVVVPGVEERKIRVWPDRDDSRIHVKAMRDIRQYRRECLPQDANVITNTGYELLKTTVAVPAGRSAKDAEMEYFPGGVRLFFSGEAEPQKSEPRIVDGILIEDVEYDWPDKEEDASEGFYDAQGVFREY